MQRDEFIRQLGIVDSKFDKEKALEVYRKVIESDLPDGNPRGHHALIICDEELAELGQEVCKELRDKGDYYNILQELADVQLCIYIIQEVCNISNEDLQKGMNVKVGQVKDGLDKNGVYK